MLSNLINNAIEALPENGKVTVTLVRGHKQLLLHIIDNGCGISTAILPKILEGGISIGKAQGTGLGLSHALKMIQSWGGQLILTSTENQGTTVEIKLPEAPTAPWFASKLEIGQDSQIAILDDDPSIHSVWEKQLEKYVSPIDKVSLNNFFKAKDFVAWHQANMSKDVVYLIDYELIGSSQTGLELIEELDIAKQAFLVTSRHEDEEIRQHCEKLQLKIIPKNYAAHIKIEALCNHPDYIFIDDSHSLTMAWKFNAEYAGKRVATFNNTKDFKQVMAEFDREIPIYIDSDLREAISGQDFAKYLYDNGFKNIYLATGFEKSHFGDMPWITAVVEKEPPF